MAVMGLVIEAIQKIESGRIGLSAAMSALPTASRWTTRSGVATSVTTPDTSLLSTKGRIRSPIAEMGPGPSADPGEERAGALRNRPGERQERRPVRAWGVAAAVLAEGHVALDQGGLDRRELGGPRSFLPRSL